MAELKTYYGKFPTARPTAKQVEAMRKLGFKMEVIENSDREAASVFIHKKLLQQYGIKRW